MKRMVWQFIQKFQTVMYPIVMGGVMGKYTWKIALAEEIFGLS